MYLISNFIGCFVFNQNYRLRESILNKPNSEVKLLKKFKNIKKVTPDDKNYSKLSLELRKFKTNFYEENIKLTRKQISESVGSDQIIIQTSYLINDLKKTINKLVSRLRDLYSMYLPEVENEVKDHIIFTKLVQSDKKVLLNKYKIKNSMGADLSKQDLDQIKSLAKLILLHNKERELKEKYLETKMMGTCPNVLTVAGCLIGAKLMEYAGSLKRLAVMPASTLQLLGAEKALFRHMTTGAKPPRHGIIVNHPLISGKPQKEHGKRARSLADKISLAAKVDYFKGKFIGDKLVKELKDRFS